jgi:hypothetical protein
VEQSAFIARLRVLRVGIHHLVAACQGAPEFFDLHLFETVPQAREGRGGIAR